MATPLTHDTEALKDCVLSGPNTKTRLVFQLNFKWPSPQNTHALRKNQIPRKYFYPNEILSTLIINVISFFVPRTFQIHLKKSIFNISYYVFSSYIIRRKKISFSFILGFHVYLYIQLIYRIIIREKVS